MTSGTTERMRPPPKRDRRGPGRTPTAMDDLEHVVWRYRYQLAPFLLMFWLGAMPTLPVQPPPVLVPLAGVAAAVAVLRFGARAPARWRLPGTWGRVYMAVLMILGSLWYAPVVAHDGPTSHDWLVLVSGTCLAAIPWWYLRRNRGSIVVKYHGVPASTVIDGSEGITYRYKSAQLINDWTAFSAAAQIQGSYLRALVWDPWSVTLSIELRRGATLGEFTRRRLAKIESAFRDCRHGAARVEPGRENRAGLIVIRIMLVDPHENPIAPPEMDLTDLEEVIIGLFETGEKIKFKLINTIVAGATDAGKSGVINVLIRALARMRMVAIVGIDLKPGAPELSPWRDVMHTLATDPAECREVFERLIMGLTWRGEEMARRGWKTWRPSREHPFIVIIIDEARMVKRYGLGKLLDDITDKIRAYGGCVITATQYPTTDNLSATVKQNSKQRVGLRVEDGTASRVVFGDDANRVQFTPHTLPASRPGSLLIRSPHYATATVGRAFFVTEEIIPGEVAALAEYRTTIDTDTWPLAEGETGYRPEIDAGGTVVDLGKPDADIVDAEIVDTAEAKVLHVIGAAGPAGINVTGIVAAAGVSRATAYRCVKVLTKSGDVESASRGNYRRT